MIEVLILAIALSMDAFAVSIGLGAKHTSVTRVSNVSETKKPNLALPASRSTFSLGLLCAVYFGVFQGIMPLFGYLGGRGVLSWVDAYAPFIAFVLLLAIGIKMIHESMQEGIEEDLRKITHKVMLTLAIATSIDAMAAGFSLTILDVNPFIAALVIGVTTFVFSWLGVIIGNKSGSYLESKAELLGGVILVLIGFKMLFTSL